jgi:DNA replication and repair protein RecF
VPFLSVSYTNFRNLSNLTIDLLSKEVYFVGENGQGKSNLLESLYLSSYGNSFRTKNDIDLVKKKESEFSIRAIYRDQTDRTHTISVFYRDGKKRIEKNAKNLPDRKELINTVPCVLFCHEDLDFAIGSPERKRFFIDQSLSMYDTQYIDVLIQYKKILKMRNMQLKEKKAEILDVLDEQLVEVGIVITKKRMKEIFKFNQVFSKLYEEICGIENVRIGYLPSWKCESQEQTLALLFQKRNSDLLFGISMTGPHRDRIRFERNGAPFLPLASTGQRRVISLVLRMAQAQFYTENTGLKPVLLMDDVMLELDPIKRTNFTSRLPAYDQLFCTFLPGEPFENYKKETTKVYQIKDGCWYEESI